MSGMQLDLAFWNYNRAAIDAVLRYHHEQG